MTDQPTNDDEGPITPEVVRPKRGAAGRKRRADGDLPIPAASSDAEADGAGAGAGDAGGTAPSASGTIFRAGCLLLVALGVFQIAIYSRYIISPDDVRCDFARQAIEQANDDDEDFNDVTLPEGQTVDDLSCDEAIDLAGSIPEDEGDEPDGEYAGAGVFRTQGILIVVTGIGMVVSGVLTLRTRHKRARTAAFVFAALGILLPALGIISLFALAFVVFALAFSRDAKSIFGQGSGFLRPRPPRPAA